MRQSGEMMGLFVQSILSPDSIFKIIVEHWKIEINKKGNLSLIADNYIFFVRRKQILCLSCNNSIIYSIVCLFFFTSTELFAVHSETDRKTESKQRNLKNFLLWNVWNFTFFVNYNWVTVYTFESNNPFKKRKGEVIYFFREKPWNLSIHGTEIKCESIIICFLSPLYHSHTNTIQKINQPNL